MSTEKSEQLTEEEKAKAEALKAAAKPILMALGKVNLSSLALGDDGTPGVPFDENRKDKAEAKAAYDKFLTSPAPVVDAARRLIQGGAKLSGRNDTEKAVNALSQAFAEVSGIACGLRV